MDDGAGIRELFLAAVRAAQREAALLALGATAFSLAAAAIFGWLCYALFTFAGAMLFDVTDAPPLWLFLAGATIVFFAAGAYYYRLKHPPEPDEWEPSLAEVLLLPSAPASALGYTLFDPTFVGLFCALPGLVFHLLAVVATTRHLAASRETIDLAVELITLDPERIPFASIEQSFEREPQRTREALELLGALSFVLPRPRAAEGFTLSMRCQVFLGTHDSYGAPYPDEDEDVAALEDAEDLDDDDASAPHSR